MSKYLGNFGASPTIDFKFFTVNPSQVPTALAGGTVGVYKSNGTAESYSGVSLGTDFDGITGMNHVRIVGTDAFYAVSNDFQVVLVSGTVGTTAVSGCPLRDFSIQNRYGTSDYVALVGTISHTLSRAEPGQGAPAATTDAFTKLDYLYKAWRNKKDHDGTTFQIYNDAGTTVDHKSTDTDNGAISTSGEIVSGA